VEVVYSEGFNPHPKISFGAPLPVGMAGEREFVDVDLRALGFEELREAFGRLSAQMPPGIAILSWQILPDRAPKLMALLDTAVYGAEVPWEMGDEAFVGPERTEFLERSWRQWLQSPEILWERRKEAKVLSVNIRPFIRTVSVSDVLPLLGARQMAVLEIVTVLGNAGSVRPLEILGAFSRDRGVGFDLAGACVKRRGVYWLDAYGERRGPDEV
jgi:radical SAM-linked protein